MDKGKLLIAIMYSDKSVYAKCKNDLIDSFGRIEKESDEYNFDKFTSYYAKEMGNGLVKRFVVFKKEIDKEGLKKAKLKTTEIEKKFSKENKRAINLDPGYLSSSELVLASFKKGTNYKEDVGDGVYLHKVLEFDKGKIITFWHTFPDYRGMKGMFLGLCLKLEL